MIDLLHLLADPTAERPFGAELSIAVMLEVLHQGGGPSVTEFGQGAIHRAFDKRYVLDARARLESYPEMSTVWHRVESREGIVYEDDGNMVKVRWDWPEELSELHWVDKADICFTHLRNQPREYFMYSADYGENWSRPVPSMR